ncbi:MAG: MaoC family dehydratase [Alphaproteobacteria bacterium]|nr:MaoC family dehydratase [Alphaproteobacteria bacterium]
MHDLYLDDFAVGDRFVTAGATVTESQILDFGLQWDPQHFHIDVESAKQHEMGGLLASGLHTLCLTFRLFVVSGVLAACNITGGGVDNLRWLRPVRPGDTLRVNSEVTSVRGSRSKPDRGTLTMHYTTINQRNEPVLELDLIHIVRRRPDGKTDQIAG